MNFSAMQRETVVIVWLWMASLAETMSNSVKKAALLKTGVEICYILIS
jgi:hypothetical protein